MPDSSTFFVIQRLGGVRAFFDVQGGAWLRSIHSVNQFKTRERATAYALEWCLEGQACVVPYRLVPDHKPERLQHDEDHE